MARIRPPVARGILVVTGRSGDAALDAVLDGLPPPLVDRPLVLRAAELLVSLGCRQLEVVLGENPAQARDLLGEGERLGCAVRYHYAPDEGAPLDANWTLRGAPDELVWFGCDRSLPAQSTLAAVDAAVALDPALGAGADGIALLGEAPHGAPAWSRWGCFAVRFLRLAAARRTGWLELEAQIRRGPRMRRMSAAQLWVATSGAALVAAQRRFLIEPDSPTGISMTSRAPGLWVSPRAEIHPQARLVAPAYVGRNVLVAAGATIGPGAVVLEDCAIGADTEVVEALVLPKTLVGPALSVRGAILNGDRYLHAALETTVKVSDPGLVAPLAGSARRARRVPLWQRLLAAALWPACLPWLLYRIARGRWPGPPLQDKEALFRQQAGAWQRHFANVVLPRLGMVVAGRAGLTGLELREGAELRRLDADWRALYASRPMGLVSESLLLEDDGLNPAARRVADLCAARGAGAAGELLLLRRYLGRVLREWRDGCRAPATDAAPQSGSQQVYSTQRNARIAS